VLGIVSTNDFSTISMVYIEFMTKIYLLCLHVSSGHEINIVLIFYLFNNQNYIQKEHVHSILLKYTMKM